MPARRSNGRRSCVSPTKEEWMVSSDRVIAIAFSAATLLGVAACSDSTGAGIGTVNVRLTNASVAGPMAADVVTSGTETPIPSGYVKSVDIFVVRIDAKAKEPTDDEAAQATEESESSRKGWVTVAEPNRTFDLMTRAHGTNTILGDTHV